MQVKSVNARSNSVDATWKLGEGEDANSGVLDHGSKLRGPSPKPIVLLCSVTLVSTIILHLYLLIIRVKAELNLTVTCMVLQAKANDRRTSSPLPR
ncbi:hypothetical protein TNCV_2740841 [Trichonephila clavipes]|nr:hypothetical protein TNCV_2740841 [Trichonephila clavipes]